MVGGSVVEERAPLLAAEVEIEVLERAAPADGEAKPRWQPNRSPGIDGNLCAVFQDSRCVTIDVVSADPFSYQHIADLSTTAATMDVIGDDAQVLGRMGVQPSACGGIDLDFKASLRGH